MIEYQEIPGTNILEFTLDGGFSKPDFDRVAGKIDEMIAQHGTIRILEVIRNIGSVEPSALWADLKFATHHLSKFSHVAVVADHKWIDWMTAAFSPFLPMKVRTFPLGEIDVARQWLRGD